MKTIAIAAAILVGGANSGAPEIGLPVLPTGTSSLMR
jgi:hypothetical protein